MWRSVLDNYQRVKKRKRKIAAICALECIAKIVDTLINFLLPLLKRVRFSTSVLFSLSIGVELLTPAFPNYFLLLATIANIAKQVTVACYLATGVSFLASTICLRSFCETCCHDLKFFAIEMNWCHIRISYLLAQLWVPCELEQWAYQNMICSSIFVLEHMVVDLCP